MTSTKERESKKENKSVSFPNFEKLTILLNRQKNPSRSMKILLSVCKPSFDS